MTPQRWLAAGVSALIVVVSFAAIQVEKRLDTDPAAGTTRPASAAPSHTAAPAPLGTTKASRVRGDGADPFARPLPGMPAALDGDVYAATRPGMLSPVVADDPAYLYVPNAEGAPITTVIDQRTRKVVRTIQTGTLSQHVTPSYDLSTLYVEASSSNRIVQLDPHTGTMARSHPVDRPYNLYFTPDGKHAIVMDEQHQKINFADPTTFQVQKTITSPTCRGPNHADFSANGRYLLVSCEFSGSLLKISTAKEKIVDELSLGPGAKPQDVRLAPNGRSFYVADMSHDRLLEIAWEHLRVIGRTSTPSMPHGIYPSRDGQFLYVSDRAAAAVSVFSLAKHRIVDTWHAPPGGTPDMGGVSADGKTLWLTGRSTGYVYGWDTGTGKLVANIRVGGNPHGLLVWPQPGRYSLGHTGNLR